MLKVGILGCGRIGQVHARSIRNLDNARVVAVADAMEPAAEALAAKSGAEVAAPPMEPPGHGICAIVIQDGIESGLWQL